jgi:hypothetical protein
VVGVQYMLSSGHPVEDVCDAVTNSDLYGMGPGVYPKDHLPPFPLHIQCLCSIEHVYIGEAKEATASDFDPKRGEKFIKSLSKGEQESLMGVGGRKEFLDNPKDWRGYVKGWNNPQKVTKKDLIPKDKLYGEK